MDSFSILISNFSLVDYFNAVVDFLVLTDDHKTFSTAFYMIKITDWVVHISTSVQTHSSQGTFRRDSRDKFQYQLFIQAPDRRIVFFFSERSNIFHFFNRAARKSPVRYSWRFRRRRCEQKVAQCSSQFFNKSHFFVDILLASNR